MSDERRWIESLAPEEISFVRKFVLSSGSLKTMAEDYGVSYPTIRQRLDELIEKVRQLHKEKPTTELRRVVRKMVAEGALDLTDARRLLSAAAKDLKNQELRQTQGEMK